jgi:lipopolysaccharide/colanic/teichoic acid biosynthesis glycosyltransferase
MMRKTYLLLLADLTLIAGATVAAFLLRDNFGWLVNNWRSWATYTGLTALVAMVVFVAAGTHRSFYRFSNLTDYLWLSSLTVVSVLATLALGFLINRLDGIARTLPVLQTILVIAALVVARVGYRLFHARQMSTRNRISDIDQIENVLVVGVNPVAELFMRSVDFLGQGRIRVHGVLSLEEQYLRGRRFGTHTIAGVLAESDLVLAGLKVHGVEITRVIVAVEEASLSAADRARLSKLETNQGIEIDFFANRLGLPPRRVAAKAGETGPEMAFRSVAVPQGPYRFGKRLFDLLLATVLLILLWPLIILVSVIVWIDVDRPLLFWQQRPGQGGRPIQVFKFRTMSRGHDDDGHRVADLQRLSATGAMLRSRRLDELPQLFNILVGDMSFVGPRPLLPIDQPDDRRDRLRAKPGLTGWAQVMGGRSISAGDKAALDNWYINNMSFVLDIEIMLRTIPMVLFGERINAEAIRRACELTGRIPDYPEARSTRPPVHGTRHLEHRAPPQADSL